MGREALVLTNEYRATHNLPPLKWHQALADIAREHSEAMGSGRRPIGHAGFAGRVKRIPFPHGMASENVAMSAGEGGATAAQTAVNGWG